MFFNIVSLQNGEHGIVDTYERRLRCESVEGFSGATTSQAGFRCTK